MELASDRGEQGREPATLSQRRPELLRPLRIAGIDPERGFGGGETQVLALTSALLRAGHRAELMCDPAGKLWARAQLAAVTCHPLAIRNSIDIVAGLRLRALLRQGHYDIVHFHTARAHALAPYARGHAQALIVTRRMDYVPNRIFAPWLFNRAVDGVAAISQSVATALEQAGVRNSRIAVVPSGVDCAHFAPPDPAARAQARTRIGAGPDEVAVGIVAALTPRKGHHLLLEALEIAAGEAQKGEVDQPGRPRLRCFIAGAGPLRDAIATEIDQRKLGDCVSLIGPLEDPRSLLWALDIFVMPSRMEGLGVAVLEAMACGVPIVACAVGGLREAVEHGRTGLLVGPKDPSALARALTRLATTPRLRAAMGAAGRETVVARFAMEKMATRTLELYRASLDSAHRTAGKG
jgi:L-malate glycosyltransferase